MASKILYSELATRTSTTDIIAAAKKSFEIVGGEVTDTKNGFHIERGTNQIKYTFTAGKFSADFEVKEFTKEKKELICKIDWSPHWFHFPMFIWGFMSLVTWIYNILYLLIKPTEIYQRALDRTSFYLEDE